MAELILDPLRETDLLNADSLNSRFTAVGNSFQDTINNLVPDAVGAGSFNENHAPSPVLFSGGQIIGGPGPDAHEYTWAVGVANNNTVPPSWTGLNSDGDAGTGTFLEIDLGADYDLTSTSASQGILVMADIHLTLFNDSGAYPDIRDHAAFIIQVKKSSGAGSWDAITRSLRSCSTGIVPGSDAATALREIAIRIPIRTLLKAGDTSTDIIRKIRVAISLNKATGVVVGPFRATLAWAQLSAIILKAERI